MDALRNMLRDRHLLAQFVSLAIDRLQENFKVSISLFSDSIFLKGDILFLHMNNYPIRTGEIVVFNVVGRDIPIVHRVIEVHERRSEAAAVDILTEGDNDDDDDRGLYAHGKFWLQQHHIVGQAIGHLPYVGWLTILMTEKPILKYLLMGALGLLMIISKD